VASRERKRTEGSEKSRGYALKKILVCGAIAVLLLGVGLYFLLHHVFQSVPVDCSQATVARVAIVDHLSASQGNLTFIEESTALLVNAGFDVDYYPTEAVTVELYRSLPQHCYSLILLRVHSASFSSLDPEELVFDLFTSEEYSRSKYVAEQLDDRLRRCAFDTSYDPYEEGDPTFFGITHKFVRHSMKGEFYNTIVIMMGCDGMKHTDMARAFVERGAKVYIGWNELVTAPHTDNATLQLLEKFVNRGQTLEEAVSATMDEVGADPTYGSVLLYYPLGSANCAIDDVLAR